MSTIKPEHVITRKGITMVLYAGLLDAAHAAGLKSIITTLVQAPAELNNWTAIVHARVEVERGLFTGLGDANSGNVNPMIAPHLIRMAETRAKARALRDAINLADALADDPLDERAAAERPDALDAPPAHERAPAPSASAPATNGRADGATDGLVGTDEDQARRENAVDAYQDAHDRAIAWGLTIPGHDRTPPLGASPEQILRWTEALLKAIARHQQQPGAATRTTRAAPATRTARPAEAVHA